MIKNAIIEDVILLAVLALGVYLLWDKISGGVSAVADKAGAALTAYGKDVKTALSPWEAAQNLFTIATSPAAISQDQFRANIAEIQANMKGKGNF